MSVEERLRVPIGSAPAWSTAPGSRRVLVVAHTVTALTRLLDILPLLESDPRVQVVFTRARTSNFREGVTEFLGDIGAVVAPWEQAVEEEFDLALSASYGDDLHRIKAPMVVFSHGAGYNKLAKPETAGAPAAELPHKDEAVFGLSRQTLLRDGALVPQTLVLSHSEQLDRLNAACPEAVDAALVAGDPTYDRVLAGLPWRERYRDHLETGRRRLVLISSTWGPTSLLGRWPDLPVRLVEELPVDEYRVALVLHPNVWHGHGPWQVRAWLADAERAELRVLPPRQGWQAALVAADHVVGDHGSVTFYGAALGTHTILGAFPHHEMASDSPIAAFGRTAALLRPDAPLLSQIVEDSEEHTAGRFAETTRMLTSVPGKSGALLRSAFYRILDLPEPAHEVRVTPPDPPVPHRRGWPDTAGCAPLLATAEEEDGGIRVTRHPAEPAVTGRLSLRRPHTVTHADEPQTRWRDAADVVVCGPDRGDPWRRIAEALEAHPGARLLAAAVDGDDCLVGDRAALRHRLSPEEGARDVDPAVFASAFWRLRRDPGVQAAGTGPAEGLVFTVLVGDRSVRVRVAREPP
ncbi:hypothetical protein [Nocardiopsis dassonvillei]|uniref:Translation initiation factor 2 n=1 Tax=Nocardiopsis dassonvillei (strain ATCC 23218 / DSM 43111 / CIP 107115 / JCM 7437 / KCTC 9190 / NBRC 14626 / NCTC 10488 / NRRL B-5397 / IMRU 509) TaxID=446468 RepID=D7B389_NOCDD|nr:hypothetical protein [Nocardiopsis dassonvillei]ADH66817.1 hypothetical protein Ndas_1385 [Nocardiopsis dassonvillei subsp. dassonvillei DSM 43111]VEI86489.1 Uncharacterised protein [Nocardiopsis dassonvillei]